MATISQDAAIKAGVSKGAYGPLVVQIRRLLGAQGYYVPDPPAGSNVDLGSFDAPLDKLVRQFQNDKRLQVDGIVGPYTWGALNNGAAPSNDLPAPVDPPAGTTSIVVPDSEGEVFVAGDNSGLVKLLLGVAVLGAGAWWFSRPKTTRSQLLSGLFDFDQYGEDPVDDGSEERKAEARRQKAREKREEKRRAEEAAGVRDAVAIANRREQGDSGSAQDLINMRARVEALAAKYERAGMGPGEASVRARAELMAGRRAENPLRLTSSSDRGLFATQAKLRAEARRLHPSDDAAFQREYERLLRTGQGTTSDATSKAGQLGKRRRDLVTAAQLHRGSGRRDADDVGGKVGLSVPFRVDHQRFLEDKGYREQMKSAAKARAVSSGAKVNIVAENRAYLPTLWSYDPTRRASAAREAAVRAERFSPVREDDGEQMDGLRRGGKKFRDVINDQLIDEAAVLAQKGDCKKAVKKLFITNGLVKSEREHMIRRRVEHVVAHHCADELEHEAVRREEDLPELPVSYRPMPLKAEKHDMVFDKKSGTPSYTVRKSAVEKMDPELMADGRKQMKAGRPVDVVEILPDGTIVSVSKVKRENGKLRTVRRETKAKRGKLTIVRGRKVPQ